MPETLPLSLVKARLSELVDRVEGEDERIVVTRNGRAMAVRPGAWLSPARLRVSSSDCPRRPRPRSSRASRRSLPILAGSANLPPRARRALVGAARPLQGHLPNRRRGARRDRRGGRTPRGRLPTALRGRRPTSPAGYRRLRRLSALSHQSTSSASAPQSSSVRATNRRWEPEPPDQQNFQSSRAAFE
jgi:Antitoxin Phd_YefM, type II toxin-antitoxin system